MPELTVEICNACADGQVADGRCSNCGAPQAARPELPLLTATRLRAFRSCARYHHLRYGERWQPAVEAEALRFGTLIHKGLEAWWTACGDGRDDPLDAALAATNTGAADDFERVRAHELLRGYDARWRADAALHEVLGVEAEYRAPLLNPATMAPSRTYQLGGKIDAIVRRRDDGRVVVVEHKTTSDPIEGDAADYWQGLAIDGQISGYVVGAESLGHRVDEVLYDVIRKVELRPKRATPVESRRYTKQGVLDARQRETDETVEEYAARVAEDVSANPGKYFQRRDVPRTNSQIAEFLQDAWQLGRAMRAMQLDGHAPRNPDACHRYGACPMWLACSTGTSPADHPAHYRRSENLHPELAGTN